MARCMRLSRSVRLERDKQRAARAGYGRHGSNLDRCFWVAGELRCPVPAAERANFGEHTARRPVGPE